MRRYTKIRIGRLISTVKISISPIYFPFFSIQELFLQNAVSIISTLRKGKESRRNRKECLPKKYIHADRQTDKNNALEKGKKGGGSAKQWIKCAFKSSFTNILSWTKQKYVLYKYYSKLNAFMHTNQLGWRTTKEYHQARYWSFTL